MAEDKKLVKMPHNLILENRHTLTVSGVEDIDSFDEETVVLLTDMGELTVKGESLHINKLNVDTGELHVEGDIHSMIYTNDEPRRGGGLFARLFR